MKKTYIAFGSLVIVLCVGLFLFQQTRSDNAKNVVSHEGTVTKIVYDCDRKETLSEDGQVITEPYELCDGGSFITVGDKTFQFRSGLAAEDEAYSVSLHSVKPGDKIKVVYESGADGFAFDCSGCGFKTVW